MKRTKFGSTIVLWLIVTSGANFALGDVDDFRTAQGHVRDYVAVQGKLMTAVTGTKSEASLGELSDVARNAVRQMSVSVGALEGLELSDSERRRLASVAATTQYKIFGNRDMGTALDSMPKELQPKIMQVFAPYMAEFERVDTSFSKSLVRGFRGQGLLQVWMTFDGLFKASITTIHRDNDVERTPAHVIQFEVYVQHPNDPEQLDSMTLFEEVIPWSGPVPSKDRLRTWIRYNEDHRTVTFTYSGGVAKYTLPAKREQDAGGKGG